MPDAEITKLEAENAMLRASLRELLDAYWGAGDGNTPPEFIQRAAGLCAYPLRGGDNA